ncbi:hypothetical protein V8F33_000263 [Rhypophila sp. PSN 637]
MGRVFSISSDSTDSLEDTLILSPPPVTKQDSPEVGNGSLPLRAPASLNPDPSPSKSAKLSSGDARSPSQPSSSKAAAGNGTLQAVQANPQQHHQVLAFHTPKKSDWTVDKIVTALTRYAKTVEQGHSQLVDFLLEGAENETWPDPRSSDSPDPFASMSSCALDSTAPPAPEQRQMTSIKIKQHSGEYGKSKGGQGKRAWCPVTCIKSDREPVPKYTFHHVEVTKNILTPNTMLNFVPHLRDVDPNSAEEKKYNKWLMELESLDSQSGFKTKDRPQRVGRRPREEYSKILALYLDRWLKELNIDSCSVSTLIKFVMSRPSSDDAITPQQKSEILDMYPESTLSPQETRAAEMFLEAYDRVFADPNKGTRAVNLRDVLMLNKSVETIVDTKRAKDTPSSQKQESKTLLKRVDEKVGSYSALGCLICFSHDCEHGELTPENQRGPFSTDMAGGFSIALKNKWLAQIEAERDPLTKIQKKPLHAPCKNQCYRSYDVGNPSHPVKPWDEDEISTLEQVFAALGRSPTHQPQCFVAAALGRKCWEVYRKLKELDLKLPELDVPLEKPKVKTVSFYDRRKKQLFGDWENQIVSHEHAIRNVVEPCYHEGPCVKGGEDGRYCPCAEHGLLCERFCHCTADTCGIKFTGCACRSNGKTCLQKQKEMKPCICVQLNRECDPVLCGCGAYERADPENAHDEYLHRSGCQNVPLQRGAPKTVLLGKSQLAGCGYGLFTAEDIAQDEFVIEYTGELISHDEGVRREARRGDVFDESANSSYLFTLLENEGIWVDAAIYGNLSRYINHASESDRKACNITPKVVYVNGEFRIKFTALRDIKCGEELFFNYGDYFPNLTKKLLEDGGADPAAKEAEKRERIKAATKTASKTKKKPLDDIEWLTALDMGDDDDEMAADYTEGSPKKIKKKRGGRRPGAGRKKKVPPIDTTAQAAASQTTTRHPSLEISDSQAEESTHNNTPSRRRIANNKPRATPAQSASPESANDASLVRAQLMQNSPLAAGGVKKVSKRGGARPGAGRKPKKKDLPPKTDSSSKDSPARGNHPGENRKGTASTEDSEDLPLQSSTAAATAATRIRFTNNSNSTAAQAAFKEGGTNNGRKRTREAADVDGDVEMEDVSDGRSRSKESSFDGGATSAGAGAGAGNSLLFRQDVFQVISDAPTPDEDDDDDSSSVADRSARKRQKPSRYRDDE